MPPRKPATVGPSHDGLEEYRRIPTGSVHPDPDNIRLALGDLTEMTASIRAGGIREPLVVYPHPDRGDGEYTVLFGHRRLAAAAAAGRGEVPCLIRRDLASGHARTVERLVENLNRLDLSPMEEAVAYEQLAIAGLSTAAIAKATGRNRREVAARRGLMRLGESTRAKIQDRQIGLDEAAALVDFAGDKKALAALEAAVGTDHWRWELSSQRQKAEMSASRAATLAGLAAAGARVALPSEYSDGLRRHRLDRLTDAPDRDPGATQDAHYAALEERHAAAHPGGHAAFVGESGTVTWICVDLSQHPDDAPDNPAGSEPAAAVSDAELAAHNQSLADCQTATRCRRDHLGDLVAGRAVITPAMADALMGHVAALVVDFDLYVREDDYARYLDPALTSDTPGHADAGALAALVAKTPPARALLAAVAAAEEADLNTPNAWGPQALGVLGRRRWLALVGGPLGYEWTDWEAGMLDAADQAAEAVEGGDG